MNVSNIYVTGILSPIKRKSLPEIAKVVGINSSQSLHHFIANSPWSVEELERRRLRLTLKALKDQKITVVIDETGDRKKGTKTDYVARQYLGSIGKVDNGIVSVNAYGVYENITFPLICKAFKPKGTLKKEDTYKTKIQIASEIITELVELGFNIELVLADSLYGEASSFIATLNKHKLSWVVLKDTASHIAIKSNYGVWMPSNQRVRGNEWYEFERTFSNQKSEPRYIREIIYGKRRQITYWQLTTDTESLPENSTSFVMTNIQETRSKIKKTLGNLYGLRTWVEYGFRQCKKELGWTDYRFTDFKEINKWWSIIFCVYLMISLNTQAFLSLNSSSSPDSELSKKNIDLASHPQWNHQTGWKNVLNNVRLIIQPSFLLWLVVPWLEIFPNSSLILGLHRLISTMNQFQPLVLSG